MQRAALAKEQSMKKATNVDLNLPQQCGAEWRGERGAGRNSPRNRNAFIYKQRDSRAGIARRKRRTGRAALPAAVVSSQTCAEFIFFSFSYFALTADAT